MVSRGIGNSLNNRIVNLGQRVQKLSQKIENNSATDLTNADVMGLIDSVVPQIQAIIDQNIQNVNSNVESLNNMVLAEVSKLNSIIGDPCFYEICDSGNLVGAYLSGSTIPQTMHSLATASFASATDVLFYSNSLYNYTHLLMIRATLQLSSNNQYQGHIITGRKMYDTSQEGSQYNASDPGSNVQILYNLGTTLNQTQLDFHPESGLIFNGNADNDIPTILNPASLQGAIEQIVENALNSLDLSTVNGFGDSIVSQVATAISTEIGNSNIDVSQIVADAIASSLSVAQLSAQDEADLASLIGQGIATALSSAKLSSADEAALGQLITQGLASALSSANLSSADEAALGQLITQGLASALSNATLSQEDQNALDQMISSALASLVSNLSLSADDEAAILQALQTSIDAQLAVLISNLNLTSNTDFLNAILSALTLPFNSSGQLDNHIIPSTNAAFDLGNAEKKIRHLFLSDNSLWVGDSHKISVESGNLQLKKHNRKSIPQPVVSLFSTFGENLTLGFINNKSRNGPKSFALFTDMKVQDWVDVANAIKDQYVSDFLSQENWPYKNITNGTVRDVNFDDIFGSSSSSSNASPLHIEQHSVTDPVRIVNTSLYIDYSLDPFDVAVVSAPQITITVANVPSRTKLHFQMQYSSAPCTIVLNTSSIQITTSCAITLYQNSFAATPTEYLLHQPVASSVYGAGLPSQDLTPPEVSASFTSASQVSFSFNEPMDTTKGSISQ